MTTDTIGAGRLARSGELRVIGLVSSAHFVSHFHSMVLPPLFLFLTQRCSYCVSNREFLLFCG
jgi:hypothetical protein